MNQNLFRQFVYTYISSVFDLVAVDGLLIREAEPSTYATAAFADLGSAAELPHRPAGKDR